MFIIIGLLRAPHTDDIELGCGATMARILEEGDAEIDVAVFSTASDPPPPPLAKTALRDEFYAAMKILGVKKNRLTVYDYAVRKLSYNRQDVLEELVKLRKSIDPDVVFLPSGEDLHQDHQTLSLEGLRAFKEITVWGYELPWNTITFPSERINRVFLSRKELGYKKFRKIDMLVLCHYL